MKKLKSVILLICLLVVQYAWTTEVPKHNSSVHYTEVYFEDSIIKGSKEYELLLFADSSSALNGKTIKRSKNKLPAFWINELKWGTTYFWKVVSYNKDRKQLHASDIHKFSIQTITYQSFDEIRLDVKTNNEAKNAKGLICIDYTRSIYNRKGEAIWTIPFKEGLINEGTQIRDLKFTKDNTITFLTIPNPIEMDLLGNILWTAPQYFTFQNDTVVYHHDFKKTRRGTYMVMGDRKVWRKVPGSFGSEEMKNESDIKVVDNVVYKKVLIAILLEFNKEGNVVWYWDANEYIKDEDLNHKKTRRGFPNLATHANAFGENYEGTKVYIGFRDLSRIVKIDKATKKVDYSYGEKYPSGEATYGDNLFLNQHDANVTRHNSILIFNNNGSLSADGVSSILELKDNMTKKDSVLLWRFDLDFDTLTKGKSMNGGNVTELPNSNLLLCGGALNRIFEVTKTKEIVWDVFLFARGKQDTNWQVMPQYRSSWVSTLKRCCFLAEISSPYKTKQGGGTVSLTIHNTGTCDDWYEIELLTAEGKVLQKVKTRNVVKNSSVVQLLNLTGTSRPASLRVTSGNSESLYQKLIN